MTCAKLAGGDRGSLSGGSLVGGWVRLRALVLGLAACVAVVCLVACASTPTRRAAARPQQATGAAPAVRVSTKPETGFTGRYVNRLDPADNPMVWARAGETALIPVNPTPAQLRDGHVEVRLDRGDSQIAPLFELLCEPSPVDANAGLSQPIVERWLAAAVGASAGQQASSPAAGQHADVRWRTRPAGTTDPREPTPKENGVGSRGWFVRVDMPRDAAGQGMWVGARRAPVGWLLDPPYQPPTPATDVAFWEPHHAELLAQLRPALASPLHRWRARLALSIAAVPGVAEIGRFEDPLVERLAEQIEAEWTIALRYLSASDPALAERVRRRLAGVVIIAPGGGTLSKADRVAVVWPAVDDELEQLKRVLLATGRPVSRGGSRVTTRESLDAPPEQSDGGRAERARTWLESQPSVGSWIIDDAGSIDAASDRLLATVGCVRLPGGGGDASRDGGPRGQAAASALAPATSLAPTVGTLAGGQLMTLAVPTPDLVRSSVGRAVAGSAPISRSTTRTASGSARDRLVRVAIAEWRGERDLLPDASPVRPPGLVVGPFCHDWSMDSWWRHVSDAQGEALEVEIDAATAAMLMYDPEPRGYAQGGTSSAGSNWVLYLECRDRAASIHGAEYVRVMFGPLNNPLGSARVFRDGSIEREGPGLGDADSAPFAGAPGGGVRLLIRVQEWGGEGGSGSGTGDERITAPKPAGDAGSPGRVRSGTPSNPGSDATARATTAPTPNDSMESPRESAHNAQAESSGWSVWIRVPRACIEPSLGGVAGEGTLRFGVERFGADGLRSAWPRPLTFWQSQPGRVRVDLDRWGEK